MGPPGGKADLGIALCNPAATNTTWLFRAKFSDIKIEYPSCMSHTACARRPPRIGGYHVGHSTDTEHFHGLREF